MHNIDDANLLRCACADCGEIISYPRANAGKSVSCPKCGEKSTLPPPPPPVLRVVPPPLPADQTDSYSSASFDTAPPKVCPKCGDRLRPTDTTCTFCEKLERRNRSRLITAGLCAVFVLIAGGIVVLAVTRKIHARSRSMNPFAGATVPSEVSVTPSGNTPIPPDGTFLPQPDVISKVPKSIENLKIGKFYVLRERGSDVGVITGDIENKSDNAHHGLKVTLELLDANGNAIGTGEDYNTQLNPRRVWHIVLRTKNAKVVDARVEKLSEDP